MWRNDHLRPVPDSMTQYGDFQDLFGREALHCGIVARNQHRLWVHVVGTECDLAEWNEPNPLDQVSKLTANDIKVNVVLNEL